MGDAVKLLLAALFGEDSPERKHRTVRAMFRIAMLAFVVAAVGLLEPFGFDGFARADQIDQKISAAMSPLATEVAAVKREQGEQRDLLTSIRIDQLGAKLRELYRIDCLTPADDQGAHERMLAEIETAQRQYRALTGERYPLPEECPRR